MLSFVAVYSKMKSIRDKEVLSWLLAMINFGKC